MKPLQTSSGDLLADRRADYAEMLFGSGEVRAAAEVLLGALELAPRWAMGWFRLGEMHEAAGDLAAAAQAWRLSLELEPLDHPGAALKLQLIGAAPPAPAPPSAFVETLFDHYADSFEAALVGQLDYRAPDLIADAIRNSGREAFDLAVDFGCGTGLMGERLRPACRRLEGYDLSEEMLRKARAKGIYDRLEKADLHALALPPGSTDLIAAADVFTYLGALDSIVAMAAAALRPGGVLAFSVEAHRGAEDFALLPSRRYAHGENYLRALLTRAGFGILTFDEAILRQDRKEPVSGFVIVAGACQS